VPEKTLNLHSLQPAQDRKDRKRVGRGPGSGKGKFSGRGIKGQKSRSGSHKMRAGFEGGQMPIYMRIGKLRGSTSKDAMPVGPFRTATQPVNLRDLDRFDEGAEVTPESLVEKRILKNTKIDVKLLGTGEVSKKLTVRVHAISASAREKIEAAGGTVELLREPKEKKLKKHKAKPATTPAAAEEPEAASIEEEAPAAAEAPADSEE
jgi:large subunit ribosomal protein L15